MNDATTASETNFLYCSLVEVTISSTTQVQLLNWRRQKDETAAVHHELEEAKESAEKDQESSDSRDAKHEFRCSTLLLTSPTNG